MLDNEKERSVKARHDVTQFYQMISFKRTMSRQDLARGDMTISDVPNPNSSSDRSGDDVEDDTYILSPLAHPHGKVKGLTSASGNRAARDEIVEESERGYDGGDEGKEEIFDVEEINPSSYVHMGSTTFRQPQNPDWRENISYKGKTELVREKRK
jgi:hypothetical protein